jgi:thiol-disulfide isomerase/thioredoxin
MKRIFKLCAVLSVFFIMTGKTEVLAADKLDENILSIVFHNDGKDVTLNDFKGKVVILEFWAPWCKYCQRQMPAVSVFADRYSNEPNLKVVPISIDYRGAKSVKTYFETNGIENLEVFTDEENNLAKALGVRSIPKFYMITKNGEISQIFGGIEGLNKKLLNKNLNE